MKVRTGKFRRIGDMSQADWVNAPIWELRLRSDEYEARSLYEPTIVTRSLLSGRRILILVRCEQFERLALAEVRSLQQLANVSVFWRKGWQPVNRLAAVKFPFYVVAIPPFGRENDVRFVWKKKGSPFAIRAG